MPLTDLPMIQRLLRMDPMEMPAPEFKQVIRNICTMRGTVERFEKFDELYARHGRNFLGEPWGRFFIAMHKKYGGKIHAGSF